MWLPENDLKRYEGMDMVIDGHIHLRIEMLFMSTSGHFYLLRDTKTDDVHCESAEYVISLLGD